MTAVDAGPSRGDWRNVRWSVVVKWALWGFVAAWSAMYLTTPFGWDQGIFAWVGDTIVRGGEPYRDAWDVKGPLTFYLFAAAQTLFGRTLWAIRVLDLVMLAGAVLALRVIVRHLATQGVADWAALGFILWYASGSFWHTAQPDGWMAMFCVMGFAPLLTRSTSARWAMLVAGLVAGLGLLIKPFYGALAIVPILYLLTHARDRWKLAGIGLLSLIVPAALTAAWLHSRGAGPAAVEVYLHYTSSLYTRELGGTIESRLRAGMEYALQGGIILFVLPAAVVGWWRLRSEFRAETILLSVWVVLCLALVGLQGSFFPYRLLPAVPPLVIFGAIGFWSLLAAERSGSPSRLFGYAALAVVLLKLLAGPAFDVAHFGTYVTGLRSEAAYYRHFGDPGDDIAAAGYIRGRTEEHEPVLVWGWNVAINYMSGRPSPSRFGYSLPVMLGPGSTYRAAYRREMMSALERNPPAFIVDAPQADLILRGIHDMRDFPELFQYVRGNYELDHKIGDLTIYRRQESRVRSR